jgi:hypothetical protein
MNHRNRRRHLDITIGGQAVATADVEQRPETGVVRAAVHVESGHYPPGTRARLVDAILDLPEVGTAAPRGGVAARRNRDAATVA